MISGNSRVVRKLLIKGSDRGLKDQTGKLAIDIANENEFNNIVGMLELKSSLAEKCNIKPAFKPIKKNRWQLLVFILLYCVGYFDFVVFIYPILEEWELIIYTVFFFIIMGLFVVVVVKDPGYYPK